MTIATLLADMSWLDDTAACTDVAPDLFFPVEIGRAATHADRRGKAVCAPCPLREPCLQYALDTDSQGIWGGTSDLDRQQLRRRSRRSNSSALRQVQDDRRRAVAALTAAGMDDVAVAAALGVTRATVRNDLTWIGGEVA